MFIPKTASKVEIFIPIRIGEYDGENVYLGSLSERPPTTMPSIKIEVDFPSGWWAAIEPPMVEAVGSCIGVTKVKAPPVVEEVNL